MLLYITIFVFIISIIGYLIIDKISDSYSYSDDHDKKVKHFIYRKDSYLKGSFATGIVISGIVLFTMSFILCNAYIHSEANKRVNKELYNSLIYKTQTESIRDEFGIVNKEYIDEIQNWNVELARNQELTNNFWIGVFYPDWYNDFDTIDLNEIKIKEKS